MSEIFAGIDLGGTGTRLVACGAKGILASAILATKDLGEGDLETRLTRLAAAIHTLVPEGEVLGGIGIGATGPVDRAEGIVHNLDTLPAFSKIPLVAELKKRLGVPVVIDNDAVVAAIAEQRVGAGKGAARMLMVTLGTGIGAAFLVDGVPFRGPIGAHPEAGHIPIVSGVGKCYCGAEGCWEQVASRSALQAMVRPYLPSNLQGKDLLPYAAAERSDRQICEAFDTYGALVGKGLSILHTLYMPEVTILGGTAANYLDLFQGGLVRAMERAPGFAVESSVRVSALGDEAGAIGAALISSEPVNDFKLGLD
ncbi:glucokinase [Labrys miyagiensis]|uniref:Glucokinase n=1 Tax=Labrys miyagiensis TaxID=346912 RepID=A0ABQ6CWM1_9HYPH|nr:ROK family protein [Labrys miyagiensis]GLS22677.1 glucokinase [Labrys miyagiensis]